MAVGLEGEEGEQLQQLQCHVTLMCNNLNPPLNVPVGISCWSWVSESA